MNVPKDISHRRVPPILCPVFLVLLALQASAVRHYKTARYRDGNDTFLPQYEGQLRAIANKTLL